MKIASVCISFSDDKIIHKNFLSKLSTIFVFALILITSIFTVFPNQAQAFVSVGDSFEGGIVAYIFTADDIGYIPGQVRGILAAPTDLSTTAVLWGCQYTLSGGDGSLIGTGSQNTTNIITNCLEAGTPAKLASDLIINGNSDWFLPSSNELRQVYLNRALIGNFKINHYWSSTEDGAYSAYMHTFSDGVNGPTMFSKNNALYARAIRYFADLPEPVVIGTSAIAGITKPINGATPTSVIADTVEYTATISWSETPAVFAGNTAYVATINIIPKTSYKLSGIPENFFTVDQATLVTNSADSGMVTVVFPTTTATYITYPTLTTTSATSLNSTSATLNGDVTNTGGENTYNRGFEYGFNTTYGANTIESGSFTSGPYLNVLSGLTCGTTYHYRSFSNNSVGIGYGNDQTFTTNICSKIKTESVSNAIYNTVTLNGNINDVSGGNFTTRGFEYGITTSYGTTTTETGSFGVGTFNSNIISLIVSTTYHYRAYGINPLGISYGEDNIFEISPLIEQVTSTKQNWYDIASSSDGTKLAAVNYGPGYGYTGSIYTSTDSGANWMERINSNIFKWYSIASSADGTKLAAATYPGYIYTSSDSGVTWTERTNSVSRNWTSIVSSTDGTKLAASGGGYISTSIDSGVNWTRRTNAGYKNWSRLASSSDGTRLIAIVADGYVYTSNDSGTTWTERKNIGLHKWYAVASSSDGLKLVVADGEIAGYIYTSTDGGESWKIRNNYRQSIYSNTNMWRGLASSSDGNNLAIIGTQQISFGKITSYIYTSNDSGNTWTEQSSSQVNNNWVYSISLSSDGSKISMGGASMNIYTHTLPAVPLVNTENASFVTDKAAVLNATILDLSGEYPMTKGFEYGLDTTYGNTIAINELSSERSYAMDVTALSEDTTYHYKSYATNTVGTGYGDDQTFTTSSIEEITSFNNLNLPGGVTGSATYSNTTAILAILPTSITANTNTGSISVPVISWNDTDSYNSSVAGSYTFSAVLGAIPIGYANSGNNIGTIELLLTGTSVSGGKIEIRGGGGGGTSTSVEYNGQKKDPIIPILPKSDLELTFIISGCIPGSLFSTTTGKSCTETAQLITKKETNPDSLIKETTILGCTSESLFSTISGESCGINNTTKAITNISKNNNPIIFTKSIKLGNNNGDVKKIQTYLNANDFNCGIIDGYFGLNTKKALMNFQRVNKLSPDGIAGKITIRVMNSI